MPQKSNTKRNVTRMVASGPRPPTLGGGMGGGDEPLKINIGEGMMGGGFTSVDPESRRIVPEANGRTKVKIVYVVLESQYQSSLTAAVNRINDTRGELCVEIVGYLLEELRDAKKIKFYIDAEIKRLESK